MNDTEILALARRFFDAVVRGDLEAVRAIYASDAVIWTAADPAERTPAENLAVLGWIKKNVRDFRYEDVRCQATSTGFVEQHTTCGTAPSGAEFRFPACLVVHLKDGRITRLEEYFEAGPVLAELAQPVAS